MQALYSIKPVQSTILTMSFGSTNILDDIFPTAAFAAIARKGKHLVIHLALNKPSRRSLASSGPVVHSLPSYCLLYIYFMDPLTSLSTQSRFFQNLSSNAA
jgi:hypothetical protein